MSGQNHAEILTEIRDILIDALGGEAGVPKNATTVHLAHAVRSQLGGYRGGLDSAARVCGKWAAQLTEAIEEHDIAETRIVGVRDALLRHADHKEATA